jgi:hypothetical protein
MTKPRNSCVARRSGVVKKSRLMLISSDLMLVYAAVMILLISGSRSAWLLVAQELE